LELWLLLLLDLEERSETATALRTSVIEVLAEPWADLRREWCCICISKKGGPRSSAIGPERQPGGLALQAWDQESRHSPCPLVGTPVRPFRQGPGFVCVRRGERVV
jgi:hypothetical protein